MFNTLNVYAKDFSAQFIELSGDFCFYKTFFACRGYKTPFSADTNEEINIFSKIFLNFGKFGCPF